MFISFQAARLPALIIVLFGTTIDQSWAQSALHSGPTAPVNPQAVAAKTLYHSAFAEYRPFGDDKLIPWRAANDEVGSIGGHAGHLRAKANATEAAPVRADDKPAVSGGHGKH